MQAPTRMNEGNELTAIIKESNYYIHSFLTKQKSHLVIAWASKRSHLASDLG